MPVPTSFEEAGLSVNTADPLWKDARVGELARLTSIISTYWHDVAAVGGFNAAQATFTVDQPAAWQWAQSGLGRHFVVYDEFKSVAWEGFVDRVSIVCGAYAVDIGPLTQMANRVGVIFNERVVGEAGEPIVVPGQRLALIEDTDSQDKYGIWEKWYTAGECSRARAEQIQEAALQEGKYPETSERGGAAAATGATVSLMCLGYHAMFQAYPHTEATGLTVTATAKLQEIMASDPNGIFSTDYSHMEANAALVGKYEGADTDAWAMVKGVVAQGGGADDLRWAFGIYADRKARYWQMPDQVHYEGRTDQPIPQRLGGGKLHPWRVWPGRWVFYLDVLVGKSDPRTLAERKSDVRYEFLESVRFDAPYQFNHQGGKVGRLPQMLGQMGLAGTGG